MRKSNRNPPSWISENDKYALIGLNLNLAEKASARQLSPVHGILGAKEFGVTGDWAHWLGSIRKRQLDEANIFLTSKCLSANAQVLDRENEFLKAAVYRFYTGILLSGNFQTYSKPFMLSGSCYDGDLNVRSIQEIDMPFASIPAPEPGVSLQNIGYGSRLAINLEEMNAQPAQGGNWRFNRTLSLYIAARAMPVRLDRLHQYCRCIEGLILPNAGDTKRQFKSRTEAFIGPRHHDLIGAIYDVRSDVEHLHENKYLENFDRTARLELLKQEIVAEFIARKALAHILESPNLRKRFANSNTLAQFWALSGVERQQHWGAPFDVDNALKNFDPKYVSDEELGGPTS